VKEIVGIHLCVIPGKGPSVTELSHDLHALVNSDLFSDVTFDVEGHRVFAHRAVLVARSEYFRAMFCGGLKEARHTADQQVSSSFGSFSFLTVYN